MLQENVVSCATVVALSASDYTTLLEELSQRNIRGGAVYDAVIAKAAELADVDQLVTLNERHFVQVWPAGAERIISPVSTTPP